MKTSGERENYKGKLKPVYGTLGIGLKHLCFVC